MIASGDSDRSENHVAAELDRPNLKKERARQTRDRLYRAADRLFTARGVDGVSIDDVVAEAGVSKGTFYVHFPSKDALVAALVSDRVEAVDAEYHAFLAAWPDDQSSRELILALVDRIFEVVEERIGLARSRVLYRAQLAGGSGTDAVTDHGRQLYRVIGDALERGVSRGEFTTVRPVPELTPHIVLALRGLAIEWCIRSPDHNLRVNARAHLELLLDGLLVSHRRD